MLVTAGPLAGATIDFPAEALLAPVEFRVTDELTELVPGYVSVSRALRLDPEGVELHKPITVSLPYRAYAGNEVVILVKLDSGQILELGPATDDQVTETVSVVTDVVGTFWAVERLFGGVRTRFFMPLRPGNQWMFDNDISFDMILEQTEPNFTQPIFRFEFAQNERNFGFYVTRLGLGPLLHRGEYSTTQGESYQELQTEGLWLPQAVTLGMPVRMVQPFDGFEPFGAAEPTYGGYAITQMHFDRPPAVETPVGMFDNLLRVQTVTMFRFDEGGQETVDWWMKLAENAGPVEVEIFDSVSVVQSGTVNNQPLAGEQP